MHILTGRNLAFLPSQRTVEGRVDGKDWFAGLSREVRKNANLGDRTREVFGKIKRELTGEERK